MSRVSQILRAVRIGFAALFVTAVYEITKHLCFPQLSLEQSNIITILAAGCVGLCASLIIGKKEKAAQQELMRLAAIVEHSDDAIISTGLDGIVTSWNTGAERSYGYSAGEALGHHISFCIPPQKRASVAPFLERVAKGEAMGRLETQRIAKDGRIIDVFLSYSPIRDETGKVVGSAGIARDVTAQKRAEKESHLRLAALEAAANAIIITDRRGTIVWTNRAFTTMTGYSREEVLGKNPRLLKSGEQPEAYYVDLWSTILSGKVWRGEIINRRKDGTAYVEEMTITPVTQAFGSVTDTYFVAVKQDVSARKQAEEAMLFKTALLEAQAETTIDGILVVDESDRIVLANKQFGLNFGIPDELLSSGNDRLVRQYVMDKVADPPAFMAKIEHLSRERDEKSRDELRFKNGRTFDRYSAPLVDSTGRYRGRIWYFRDITDRKVAEEQVQFLAYYDALTGLPNRTLLQDRLSRCLASARRQKDKVALLFLDLDRFKDINDSLGHSFGDLFLREVANRLKKWAREQDTVARLGGDEFLIVLNNLKDAADAAVAAERLMKAMKAEFVIQGRPLSISGSLGISIFPEHGTDGETLMKNADAAMYSAKESGRNNFRFFTDDMNAQVVERLILENSLRLALERKEFFLEYQPQMDTRSGRVTGLEALLRWRHPELGMVPPDKFIGVAENSGLIIPIGEWVLRTACLQARKWQQEGLLAAPVAVNVSALQFRQEGFHELVGGVLRDTGLAPQYLELELTESLLLSNAHVTFSVLQELKAMGLRLAIDDFGTGYSSLSYLKQFPVGKLKIDRSFVRDIAISPDDAAIATAIIGMAKSLSLKVIAEGVEDEAQMTFLRAHKCDEIQGYYFSKPLAVDKVADFLRPACLALASMHSPVKAIAEAATGGAPSPSAPLCNAPLGDRLLERSSSH